MSKKKFYVQLIESLEDPEMDKVAERYLNEVEDEINVFNCNGPYDSGLDMREFDVTNINTQFQITTRAKKFEQKLKDDLKKAKKNVEEYSLPNKVTYFYSYPLTSAVILNYKKMAKDDFGIVLNLVEANTIAGAAKVYDSLGKLLIDISEIDKHRTKDGYFDDPKVRSFYDLMSFGSSTDIKHDIIKSFVLNHLIQNEPCVKDELLSTINSHFSTSIDSNYFDGFLNKLKSEGRIKIEGDIVELNNSEREKLTELLNDYRDQEALLKKELHDVLVKYELVSEIDLVIAHLGKLYESNYSSNLGEFTDRKSNIQDLRTATEEFKKFISTKLDEQSDSESLTKSLLKIADENEIISRIAAGQVYSKVSAPDKLQEYISQNNNNKDIFLDTNVLIYLIFNHYDSEAEFNSYHYPVSKQLLDFRDKYDLFYRTTSTYAIETANIFKDALSIIPFTKLSIFDSLGGSNNVVYKFYLHLKDYNRLEDHIETFEDFLLEFKFKQNKINPNYNYLPQISHILDTLAIDIETPDRYEISSAVEMINADLKEHERHKSNFAINNDAIMLNRLGDPDVDVNPLDPIFCTWDLSLFGVRNKYFEDNPNCTKWMMYTPSRLMDHFSMMNFEVKSGSLSNEVLSILEEDYSFQSRTQSLLDSMITIINPENEVGLKYANRLGKLREKEILEIDRKEESKSTGIETSSVDVVFKDLFVHYAFNSGEGAFDSFKSIFTKDEFFDDIFNILQIEIESVSKIGVTSADLFKQIDEIILKTTA